MKILKKLRVYIIDDDTKQILLLQEYVRNLSSIKSVDTQLLPVRLRSGHTVSRTDRVKETVDYLKNNWENYDLFLVDWSLLGDKDISDPISIIALKNLFENNPGLSSEVKKFKRFVVIVTGKGSTNKISTDLSELNGVLSVDKPDNKTKPISKASCPFGPGKIIMPVDGGEPRNVYCPSYDTETMCHRSDCLRNIIGVLSDLL